MKKAFGKMFVAAAALAVVIGATSCGGSGAKMTKEDKALLKTLEEKYKDQPVFIDPETKKPYNFGGMSVVIGDFWSDPTKPAGTEMEAETRLWHKYLSLKYNFECVEQSLGSWDNHPKTVANYCLTGGEENYVFAIDVRSIGTGLKTDLFYDVSKNKDIDWSNPKWNKAVEDEMKKGNGIYGCRPIKAEPRIGLFFNKRVLEEANIDPNSIYDMQKDGTWTWENFEKILAKVTRDIDNDGVIDVWGMANHDTQVCHAILQSNGGSVIGKDANGKYFNNIESEASIEALEWGRKIHALYDEPKPEGGAWNWMHACFMNGEAAFLGDEFYLKDTFKDMEDDWGFVCFPKGPRMDDYSCVTFDNVYVVPAIYGDKKASKILKIYDIYSTPTPGYETGDDWKEEFYPQFRDERAVDETIVIMREKGSALLSKLIPGLEPGDVFWGVYQGWETMQSAAEKVRNPWQALIDQAN